jgi:queuine/archaeosine tRNA-ribosyltransferase
MTELKKLGVAAAVALALGASVPAVAQDAGDLQQEREQAATGMAQLGMELDDIGGSMDLLSDEKVLEIIAVLNSGLPEEQKVQQIEQIGATE